jgi:arabinofuranan 3-O-arabinosyltransferase
VDRWLDIDPADGPQLVTVRENQNAGWMATLPDGTPVRAAAADGWQQAWWVPAGAEALDAEFAPDLPYRVALGSGGLVLGVLAATTLLAALRRRRPQPPLPRSGPRAFAPGTVTVVGLVVLGLAAGWWGVAGGAVGAGLGLLARRRVPPAAAAIVGSLPLVVAALFYWVRPLGSADGWAGALVAPQVLVALALGALAAADVDLGDPRLRSRWLGRSTAR